MDELKNYRVFHPGEFERDNHWYDKALNATIHPLVNFFLHLSKDRIINRYCHLHPAVKPLELAKYLEYQPQYFRWSGADLMHVTKVDGHKQMVILENNSCPSGQKSMPLLDDNQEQGGYRKLLQESFRPYFLKKRNRIDGELAVIYDKNPMETSGYASVMSDVFNEPVHWVSFYNEDPTSRAKFENGILYIKNKNDIWIPIRAAFRYVTQKPWNRIPIHTKTWIFNPAISCLAGGRNKLMAAKAYDLLNAKLKLSKLKILTPQTIWDVGKMEIPLWVAKLGGKAVIKNPYSNAGQGVWTIVHQRELDEFMANDYAYDRFIVQSLIGNYNWSSEQDQGRLFHVGTIPNGKGNTYVADLRMMICASPQGFIPLAIYARRAKNPLKSNLAQNENSWDILGTNLSVKLNDNEWNTETNRLIMMDRRDFNRLGIGLDDLIDAYIQAILSTIAIDQLAITLFNKNNKFRTRLFNTLDDDARLISEILID